MKIDKELITSKPACYIFDIDGCIANVDHLIKTNKQVYEIMLKEYNAKVKKYEEDYAEYRKKSSLNYVDIATVGGYSVAKASTFSPSKGVFAFNHNIGNTNYTITWIGNKKYSSEGVSGTDVYGFQGSAAFTKSSTSFTVKFADKDGDTSLVPHTGDGRRSVDLCIFTQTL